jgi:hypothetical protein
MSFHDEASAEIGESQFVNTDEIARLRRRQSYGAQVSHAMRALKGLRSLPWIPDPVKDRFILR